MRAFVPWVGIEPTLSKELDFESSASTNSATKASFQLVSNLAKLLLTNTRFPIFFFLPSRYSVSANFGINQLKRNIRLGCFFFACVMSCNSSVYIFGHTNINVVPI